MNKKRLLVKIFIGVVGLSGISILGSFSDSTGWAQMPNTYKLPKVIYWAAADVGSGLYTQPAVIAEKIAPILNCKFRLIPGNDVDRINMLRAGKAHLAAIAADNWWASMGLEHYGILTMGPQPLRLIWAGWPYCAGSTGVASAASGIKTPYDLKGKRVVRIVGAAWSSEGVRAILAFGKLTLNDVTIVEVSSTGAMYKALAEGKADFTICAPNTPGGSELEASPYGIYILRFPHEDKEGWARYRKIMPYHVPGYSSNGPGIKPGEQVPTPVYSFPLTSTLASQSEEFVYAICKAMYQKIDEIINAYPVYNEAMKPDRAVRPEATIMAPFHPGAVKFFKEVGLWKEAHEAAQKKRLAQQAKVESRWVTYVDEANEKMLKTGKQVTPKEWREIVEKEIGLLP